MHAERNEMNKVCLVIALLTGLLVSGCAGMFSGRDDEQPKERLVVQVSDADTILMCLASQEKLSRKEFAGMYKTAVADAARGERADMLRVVCLSLHRYASYKQFKDGKEMLAQYLQKHPESTSSLQGLLLLIQRIDREKIVKKVESNKIIDEKEGLETENRDLMERNETLERNTSQDQERIKELQQQIEQLKNIESIIKKRER
jgi:outer membrane murein-binding lipoprotein Lpp